MFLEKPSKKRKFGNLKFFTNFPDKNYFSPKKSCIVKLKIFIENRRGGALIFKSYFSNKSTKPDTLKGVETAQH